MPRWLCIAVATCAVVAGCSNAPDSAQPSSSVQPPLTRSQQAGQPVNPVNTVGHIIAFNAAALTGDQHAAQAHLAAMQHDQMRAMRLADPARRIDHETARATVRTLDHVRSAVWIDTTNLLVRVDGSRYRNMATIDRICLTLEPLGDTLGVVVNLQDATATTSEGADTLSRNCQLAEGEQALMQPKRQMDVLDPELRRAFRAQQRSGK